MAIAEVGINLDIPEMYLFLSDSIPVVLGGKSRANYDKILPPKSFISVEDFPSVDDLVKFIKFLGQHEVFLLRFHEWRKVFSVVQDHGYFEQHSQ